MGTTVVDICNSALLKLGSAPLMSIEEDTREGRLCRAQYGKLKMALLNEHPWSFAKRRIKLNRDAKAPEFGFKSRFLLPSDFLRVLNIYSSGEGADSLPSSEWVVEGDYMLSENNVLYMVYITDEAKESRFPAIFAELLSLRLAMDICYDLVQDKALYDRMSGEYKMYLQRIQFVDSRNFKPKNLTQGDGLWVQSRF